MELSFSREQLQDWAERHVGLVGIEVKRVSSILLVQLIVMQMSRQISVFSVTDELQALEGRWPRKGTKQESKFYGAVLRGLWKKHFTDPRFLAANVAAHFEINNGGNNRLREVVDQAFRENTSGYVDEQFARTISHLGTVAALSDRARKGKLTGEWIVFHRHRDKNYYLTLAKHSDDEDEVLRRVKLACELDDYPFRY